MASARHGARPLHSRRCARRHVPRPARHRRHPARLVGATEAEIANITGTRLRDVHAILDMHYLARDPALGENAIRKLERGTKTPN